MKAEYAGLAFDFYVNPSSCDNPDHYEQYLRFSAVSDNTIGHSKTHVFICEQEGKRYIMGFISLRCTSLLIEDDGIMNGRAALEIYELAVHKDYEKQGVGTILVELAIKYSEEINTGFAGVEFITLCSDPKSTEFYAKNGFNNVSDMYVIPRDIWNQNCVPMMMKLF